MRLMLTIGVAALLFGAAACRAQTPAAPKDPALRAELARRIKADQDARFALINYQKAHPDAKAPEVQRETARLVNRVQAVDAGDLKWLKGVVARRGWPGKSLVGEDGAHDAWLLVQHADADRAFQRRCLTLMEAAAGRGEVRKDDLAYLTDRVLVGEGKKQRYGTQARIENGEVTPLPIEDEANVDSRRAALGLPPLKQYLDMMREMYLGKKP